MTLKTKLAKFKVQETEFLLEFERLQLQNKINAQKIELTSYLKQIEFAKTVSVSTLFDKALRMF